MFRDRDVGKKAKRCVRECVVEFSSGEWGRAEVEMYEECQELNEDKRNAASAAARPDGG